MTPPPHLWGVWLWPLTLTWWSRQSVQEHVKNMLRSCFICQPQTNTLWIKTHFPEDRPAQGHQGSFWTAGVSGEDLLQDQVSEDPPPPILNPQQAHVVTHLTQTEDEPGYRSQRGVWTPELNQDLDLFRGRDSEERRRSFPLWMHLLNIYKPKFPLKTRLFKFCFLPVASCRLLGVTHLRPPRPLLVRRGAVVF